MTRLWLYWVVVISLPLPAVRVEPNQPDFDEWYRGQWPRLVGAMVLVTGDVEAARDVAAQAFLRAYEGWEAGVIRDPGAWTYRVAVNLAHRQARRAATERRLLLRTTRPATEVAPGVEPELWRAVARLPERQRTAVGLRYIADLTQAEVAGAMGVSPGTAAATLSAARAALRQVLSEPGGDGPPLRGARP